MSNQDTISPENLSVDQQVQQTIVQLQQTLAKITVEQASQIPTILGDVEAFQKIEQQLAGTFEKRMAYSKLNRELQELASQRTIETKQIEFLEDMLPSIKKRAEAEFFDKAILPSLQQLTSLLNEYEPQFSNDNVLQKHIEGIRLIEKSFIQSLESLGFTAPTVLESEVTAESDLQTLEGAELDTKQEEVVVESQTNNESGIETTPEQEAQDLSQSEANNKE